MLPPRRRTSLRRFQMELSNRMNAAQSGLVLHLNQLGVISGETRWMLNLHETSEIVSVGPITKIPLTQDWYLGLSNIRGTLVGIIDLARLQGQGPTIIDKNSRIVVLSPRLSSHCGLLVSKVMGLRDIREMTQESHSEANATMRWTTDWYCDDKKNTWVGLDLVGLLKAPEFLHISLSSTGSAPLVDWRAR